MLRKVYHRLIVKESNPKIKKENIIISKKYSILNSIILIFLSFLIYGYIFLDNKILNENIKDKHNLINDKIEYFNNSLLNEEIFIDNNIIIQSKQLQELKEITK